MRVHILINANAIRLWKTITIICWKKQCHYIMSSSWLLNSWQFANHNSCDRHHLVWIKWTSQHFSTQTCLKLFAELADIIFQPILKLFFFFNALLLLYINNNSHSSKFLPFSENNGISCHEKVKTNMFLFFQFGCSHLDSYK